MTASEWSRQCVLCATRGRKTTLEAGHVCAVCQQRIVDDLTAILDLAAWASVEPVSGRGQGRTVPSSRPPINVDGVDPALTLVDLGGQVTPLLEIVESWERLVREARGMAPYGPVSHARAITAHAGWNDTRVTLSGSVTFLRASVPWWAESPDQPIDDFAAEMRACRRALLRWDPDREPLGYVAYCPTDGCGARLRYHAADEQVTCPRCRVTRDVPQLVAVVLSGEHDDIWADPETAALHYGVSERRLRAWAQQGRIERRNGRYRIAARGVSA